MMNEEGYSSLFSQKNVSKILRLLKFISPAS